jgi:hypothetical protein
LLRRLIRRHSTHTIIHGVGTFSESPGRICLIRESRCHLHIAGCNPWPWRPILSLGKRLQIGLRNGLGKRRKVVEQV